MKDPAISIRESTESDPIDGRDPDPKGETVRVEAVVRVDPPDVPEVKVSDSSGKTYVSPGEGVAGSGAADDDSSEAAGDVTPSSEDRHHEDGLRGRSIEERFRQRIRLTVPDRHNPKLHKLLDLINEDDDLYALLLAANVNAIERLGMTDHGPVHVKIVTNIAVRLLRLLMDAGVQPGVVSEYALHNRDAEVVVTLAALLHDLGMSIHREDHEAFSLFIAERKLREYLAQVYDPRTATVIRSEVLHAIIAHRSGGVPLTIEAGVVRVADALDMAKGRSRIPFEAGSVSIHSVSAAAVDGVRLDRGVDKAVRITIQINNSAGVYQLDQLLRRKLAGSGLEKYVEVEAVLADDPGGEKRLFRSFTL